LVLCLQTISWLNNPAKALQELIRICQPNGTIVITGLSTEIMMSTFLQK